MKQKNLSNRIIPKKYQEYTGKDGIVSERYRILIDDEYLTPDYVLKNDPFFDEFRCKNKNLKNKK